MRTLKKSVILLALVMSMSVTLSACSSNDVPSNGGNGDYIVDVGGDDTGTGNNSGTGEEQKGITLHQYFASEQMPEIRITTEGGVAIDDPSLINPDERKGLFNDIAVYDYIGAKITVKNTDDFDLNEVAGQVKVRGNYTSTYDKKPIRIKFEKKQAMAGLNGGEKLKSWVLLAEWKDSSMLRNSVADYIGNCLLESDGYYCSDFRFVNVYINDKYNGVYVLAEQQQINKNRVNIPEAGSAEDGVHIGYLLEYDGYYNNETALQKFTLNYNSIRHANGSSFNANNANRSTRGFSITNDIYSQEQHDYIAKCMQTIWNVLYDATYATHTNISTQPYHTMDSEGNYVADSTITSAYEAVSKVVDVNSLVDMYILHEFVQDYDIGYSSFYFSLDMSEEGNHLLTYQAPWDFDYTMGYNPNDGGSVTATTGSLVGQQQMINDNRLVMEGSGLNRTYHFAKNAVLTEADFTFTNTDILYAANTNNPWLVICTNQSWFWELVAEKWEQAIKAGVFTGAIEMINTLSDLYVDDFAKNFDKWGNIGITIQFSPQQTVIGYFTTQKQASVYLKAWINARVSGLSTAFTRQLNSNNR